MVDGLISLISFIVVVIMFIIIPFINLIWVHPVFSLLFQYKLIGYSILISYGIYFIKLALLAGIIELYCYIKRIDTDDIIDIFIKELKNKEKLL